MNTVPSLSYLFLSSFRLSAFSWGGFSLMHACRDEFVIKKGILSEDRYADAVALAWIMPGPVASNVAVRLGAMMRGMPGAIAMGFGAALPFFLALCVMAACYSLLEGQENGLKSAVSGFTPAACAVIFSAAAGQARTLFKGWGDALLAAAALAGFMILKTPLAPVLVLAGAGAIGTRLYRNTTVVRRDDSAARAEIGSASWALCVALAALAGIAGHLIANATSQFSPALLLAQMASMSLTLFGGGLIVIPMLHQLLVSSLGWISDAEFYTAIASAQVAPGPLLSSVIFMGYRIDGLSGAAVAFAATFIPPAALMLSAIAAIHRLNQNATFAHAMRGIRIAVVGMTVAAGFFVGKAIEVHWLSFVLFGLAFVLLQKTKTPVAVIVPACGLIGFLFF